MLLIVTKMVHNQQQGSLMQNVAQHNVAILSSSYEVGKPLSNINSTNTQTPSEVCVYYWLSRRDGDTEISQQGKTHTNDKGPSTHTHTHIHTYIHPKHICSMQITPKYCAYHVFACVCVCAYIFVHMCVYIYMQITPKY